MPSWRAFGKGRGAQVFFDRPMMASQMGRDGFDCPTLLAQGLSLLIFRHPFRPVVRDLLLGFCHGNRAFRRNRHRVVILGGWLVVRHVIQLVNLAVMRIKDLLESCRQILEEMKAVGDLRGFWGSSPNAGYLCGCWGISSA